MKAFCAECGQEMKFKPGEEIPHRECSRCGCCVFFENPKDPKRKKYKGKGYNRIKNY